MLSFLDSTFVIGTLHKQHTPCPPPLCWRLLTCNNLRFCWGRDLNHMSCQAGVWEGGFSPSGLSWPGTNDRILPVLWHTAASLNHNSCFLIIKKKVDCWCRSKCFQSEKRTFLRKTALHSDALLQHLSYSWFRFTPTPRGKYCEAVWVLWGKGAIGGKEI